MPCVLSRYTSTLEIQSRRESPEEKFKFNYLDQFEKVCFEKGNGGLSVKANFGLFSL